MDRGDDLPPAKLKVKTRTRVKLDGNRASDGTRPRSGSLAVRARSRGTLRVLTAVLAMVPCAGCIRGLAPVPAAGLTLERRSGPVVSEPSEIVLFLSNRTGRPIVIPRPSDAFFVVSASTGEGRLLHCTTPPPPPRDLEFVTLDPGAALPVDVDPTARCERRSADDWRIVIRFAVPRAVGEVARGSRSWSGTTPPVHVQIIPIPMRDR